VPTNKQRREAARRHLERQLQRRQQEAARRKQRNLIATVVGAVVLVAVIVLVVVLASGDSKKKPSAAASSSTSASASPSASSTPPETAGACGYAQGATATKDVGIPPDPATTPTTNEVLDVTTNLGPMTFTLDGAAAPCNVQSIAYLATKGYYDNTSCFRLVTSGIYVLQCGDAANDGTGGPGYTVKDENLTNADYSQVGTIAMANSGADTNGSQFFIIWKDSSQGLQKSYTVIGKVTAGIDIVQKVAAAGETDSSSSSPGDGKPKLAITFTKVTAAPPVAGSGTFVTPTPTAPATSSGATDTSPADLPTGLTGAPTKSASPVS
jgi:peptidyl-prolyl cis-trans isomerase B (cyclophilin B)